MPEKMRDQKRKAARIAGLTWLVLMAVAGAVLWAWETMVWAAPVSSNRGLIYIVFGAALPGVLLYRWGTGPHPARRRVTSLSAKIPYDAASEAGHVMPVRTTPQSQTTATRLR